MTTFRFGDMTRTDLAAQASQDAILVLPLGATEQHGPHLPTCVDAAVIEHLSAAAAEVADVACAVVVAPVLSFGSSDHHLPFGGTLSVSTQTYLSLLLDLGRSAAASGFRRILLLNGHGGNHELAILAARDLSLGSSVHTAAGSWWHLAASELSQWIDAGGGGFAPGHAGALETTVARTLFPDLVGDAPHRSRAAVDSQARRRETRLRLESHGALEGIDGYTDDPAAAQVDPELVDAIVRAIAREIEHFELHTRHTPSTENEVRTHGH